MSLKTKFFQRSVLLATGGLIILVVVLGFFSFKPLATVRVLNVVTNATNIAVQCELENKGSDAALSPISFLITGNSWNVANAARLPVAKNTILKKGERRTFVVSHPKPKESWRVSFGLQRPKNRMQKIVWELLDSIRPATRVYTFTSEKFE